MGVDSLVLARVLLALELASMLACMSLGMLDDNRLPRELARVLLVVDLTITDSRASWRVCCSWMA